MTESGQPKRRPDERLEESISQFIDAFEDAWQSRPNPSIREFLPTDSSLRNRVLLELVHVDLERRFKAGCIRTIESYLCDFPELTGIETAVVELAAAEFVLRQRQGADPRVEAYLLRFPTYAEALRMRLSPFAIAAGGKGGVTPGAATIAVTDERDAPFARTQPGSDAGVYSVDHHRAETQFGDYELLAEIGRGGMGVVYKARQVSLNRVVALKMMLGGQFAAMSATRRFRTEAQAVAKLNHPGIVTVYEVGERDGQSFFSMGFVDGSNLATRLQSGPLPPQEAARVVQAVADAIQHAHEQGVIHRDLKPQNILLDENGQPKVTDFGLAKLARGSSELTETGQVLGTPAYMPPEQAAGQRRQIGPASDVYALGAILYALLTGRAPFQAASILEMLKQVLEEEPVPAQILNPSVPRELEAICGKCLQKDPNRRYSSARSLADELGRFLAGEPIQTQPPIAGYMLRVWLRRNLQGAILTFLVGVGCGLLASTCFAAIILPTVAERGERPYRELPQLEPPWLLAWRPPSRPMQVLLGILGAVALASMGMAGLLVTRPRSRTADLWVGGGVGLFAGVTVFLIVGGPVAVVSQALIPNYEDVFLIGISHDADGQQNLVRKYPDLKDLSPERRVRVIAAKVIADMVANVPVGIWLGLVGTLVPCMAVAVMESFVAGRILRMSSHPGIAVLNYAEIFALAGFGICFFLPPFGFGEGILPEYLPDNVTGNAAIVLLVVAFTGLVQNWSWFAKVPIWSAALFNLLSGSGAVECPWQIELLVYACAAAIAGFGVSSGVRKEAWRFAKSKARSNASKGAC